MRKLHIELNGSTLPDSVERIFDLEVELRTIESAITLIDFIGDVVFF